MKVVVFLPWPETCFRPTREDLAYLKTLLPKSATLVNATTEEAFLKELPTATHAFVWYFRSEWFQYAPNLHLLATPAAGRELLPAKAPMDVKLHFGRFHGEMMAESVVGFMLAWARGFFLKPENVWPRVAYSERIFELSQTRAVILGYGNVGQVIGRKLKALGTTVFGYSRHLKVTPEELTSRLKVADWLIVALPGNETTEKMLNAKMIAKLPRHCVVINVGRGSTVDEAALFRALETHRLAAAYLDVRPTEPTLRFGMPGGTEGLPPTPKLDNLVLMPHASAFSPRYLRRFFAELKNDRCL